MTVTIELRQTRTAVASDNYRVLSEVITATNIIPEIFVTRTIDDDFQRVAMVDDIVSLPRTKQDAIDEQRASYLAAAAEVDYGDVATAVYAADHVRGRVQHLVETYDEYTTEFEGQDDYTITSEGA